MSAPEPAHQRDWLRFDTYTGMGLGRPFTTDERGHFRCRACDVLLGTKKARYCDIHKSRSLRKLKVIV
jgi:hypothetical protein